MRDYEEKRYYCIRCRTVNALPAGGIFPIHELTIDHILPKKRALKTRKRNPWWIDEIFNLRLLCLWCHLTKATSRLFRLGH